MDRPIIEVDGLGKMFRKGTACATLSDRVAHLLSRRAHSSASDFWALKDVTFSVPEGEVVGIIGRNGAGKSTLLKILTRITPPTEGKITMRGRVSSLLEVGTGFHPELTGRENIYLNGAVLGMSRPEITGKFDEIVSFADIEGFLDTPVKRYSSGMYVRLAFAVAAHLEPEILIVDEVLAVGDAQFQKKCLGKMGEVARSGRTVLFVSHNMAAIDQLCTRAILLSRGKMVSLGNVNQVIELYMMADKQPNNAGVDVLARDPDGVVELLSISPVDKNGKALLAAQSGGELYLDVSLRLSRGIEDGAIALGINNVYGVRTSVLHSNIAGYNLLLTPGINHIICHVPRLALVPSMYLLDFKLQSGKTALLWSRDVEKLAVEMSNFFGTGNLPDSSWAGFCYLDQNWSVDHTRQFESRGVCNEQSVIDDEETPISAATEAQSVVPE